MSTSVVFKMRTEEAEIVNFGFGSERHCLHTTATTHGRKDEEQGGRGCRGWDEAACFMTTQNCKER